MEALPAPEWPLAEFDGYTLRAVNRLADIEHLAAWIEADDAHRGIFQPADFMSEPFAEDPRPTCYALEDERGVLFYIRISRAARVRMQFPPEEQHGARIAKGLIQGMAFLEGLLANAGVEEWIFDTMNEKLKILAQRSLGFTESTHELVRPISRPKEGG